VNGEHHSSGRGKVDDTNGRSSRTETAEEGEPVECIRRQRDADRGGTQHRASRAHIEGSGLDEQRAGILRVCGAWVVDPDAGELTRATVHELTKGDGVQCTTLPGDEGQGV